MKRSLIALCGCLLMSMIANPQLLYAQDAGNPPKKLRAGIIGLDTSHVPAFTKAFQDPKAEGARKQVQVVAGFPGGSPDIASSRDRVQGYTDDLRKLGVKIVDSIPEMLEEVDVVLLESVDGRPHLQQAIPVFRARKRIYIDKPLAGNLVDALCIQQLSKKYDVPWFSSSSLRFSPGILKYRTGDETTGKVRGAVAWSPCSLDPTHPDLYWYGVHGVETLFTIMGPGCQQVTRVHSESTDQAIGLWNDGRIGAFHGIRSGKAGYGATVFGEKEITQAGPYAGYAPLVDQIAEFFITGKAPIDPTETIELFAFMTAADVSKSRNGAPVTIAEVMADAQSKVAARLAEFGE